MLAIAKIYYTASFEIRKQWCLPLFYLNPFNKLLLLLSDTMSFVQYLSYKKNGCSISKISNDWILTLRKDLLWGMKENEYIEYYCNATFHCCNADYNLPNWPLFMTIYWENILIVKEVRLRFYDCLIMLFSAFLVHCTKT